MAKAKRLRGSLSGGRLAVMAEGILGGNISLAPRALPVLRIAAVRQWLARMCNAKRGTKHAPILCPSVAVSGDLGRPLSLLPTPVSLGPLQTCSDLKACLAGAVLDRVHASPGVTVSGILSYLPPIHPDEVASCLQQLSNAGVVERLAPAPPVVTDGWDPSPGLLSVPTSPPDPGYTLTGQGLSLFSPGE